MKASELRVKYYLGHKVYSNGIIISCKGVSISKRLNEKGYWQVNLFYDGKNHCKRLHRILAELFIPNPENKPQVNHKDRNRANYDLDNLEWSTARENCVHSVLNGGRDNWTRNNKGSNNSKSKICKNDVENILLYYNNKILTQKELSRKYIIGQSTINKIVNKKLWAH